ncbi:MAG: mannose-1-phosphate guanylyltransferase/mannose-6-phosphate isomerase [Candidatus Omnitrophica bacterium CG11_big_fil_rev_8_21_14_0_20_42_13]|uniref:mannose-1-phosphate guanylyltransferase n=1 Tax=Candidatus Ghiorseimicrobium undicola TaxID=1974746 RepID=A0A2H0LYH5_9BACT|nr:MAG: mannose-1-phosphate guanylyltransferase/mannose-6-phosphate isomerase [Candidatus Omnitrophica bacterium CG11_big_fil_rev_8_21_14_0_20_42_13]
MQKNNNLYAVILAGGSGTRFWPLSRQIQPKHLLKFYNNESLLQQTIKRAIPKINPANIYIVTNSLHKFEIEAQAALFGIPADNTILEPQGKNTAAAIALAASCVIEKNADSTLVILPADHHIADNEKFLSLIDKTVEVAEKGYIVTLGIKPTNPATGYGYIKTSTQYSIHNTRYYKISKFTEKPDLKRAKQFIKDTHYLWNSGMFIVKCRVILDEIKKHMPKLYDAVLKIKDGEPIAKIYEKLDSVSIDYGVLEKSKNTAVIKAVNLGWSDMGTLSSLDSIISKDNRGNIIQANSIDIGSKNVTIIGNKHLISTIGLNDLIIVDTEDALLVCPKNRAEDVKQMVDLVKRSGGYEHFSSHTAKRPWGTYTIIEKGRGYKVKIIELAPHKRLSLQRHKLRSEHWVVVEGIAKVICEGQERAVYSNESIFVSAGQTHRLENPNDKPLKIIEVQSGSYLEEDDIERLDDDFARGK